MNIEPPFWVGIFIIGLKYPFVMGVAIALGLIRFACKLIKDHEEMEVRRRMPFLPEDISRLQSKIQCGVGYLILIALALSSAAVIVFVWGSVI